MRREVQPRRCQERHRDDRSGRSGHGMIPPRMSPRINYVIDDSCLEKSRDESGCFHLGVLSMVGVGSQPLVEHRVRGYCMGLDDAGEVMAPAWCPQWVHHLIRREHE